jgi:hypothetical protein
MTTNTSHPPKPEDTGAVQAHELHQQALQHLEAGNHNLAAAVCGRALEIEPDNNDYIAAMAESIMPGKGYKYMLRCIHNELKPTTYLEIGVSKGKSMELASTNTTVVGVDPAFQIDADITAEARLFPIPSDDFFERYDLHTELRSDQLDLVFIDGLHLFEQVYRDFYHVEEYANENTVVLVHDCFPVSELTADRERTTNFWAGDVWKIIPCLQQERPDLSVHVIPCRPSGMAIISGLDRTCRRLQSNEEGLIRKYQDLKYSDIPNNRQEYFSTIENSWDIVREMLSERSISKKNS